MNKSHAARKMRNWEEKKFLLDFKKKKERGGRSKDANVKTVFEAMALGGHKWPCG